MRRMMLILALAAPMPLFAQTANRLQAEATAAYEKKDYATCAKLFTQLGRDTDITDNFYYAATCHALGGNKDDAFKLLDLVLERGWSNTPYLKRDRDIAALRDDARWTDVIGRSDANWAKRFAGSNRELFEISDADQADRETRPIDWNAVSKRDLARRVRVRQILGEGNAKTAVDFYNAALVLQHGDSADDYREAHELSMRGVAADPSHKGVEVARRRLPGPLPPMPREAADLRHTVPA